MEMELSHSHERERVRPEEKNQQEINSVQSLCFQVNVRHYLSAQG